MKINREKVYNTVKKEMDNATVISEVMKTFFIEDLHQAYQYLKYDTDSKFLEQMIFYSRLINKENKRGK